MFLPQLCNSFNPIYKTTGSQFSMAIKNNVCDKIEAKESDYLFVKTSQLLNSGNGLFTAINIYKDEIIAIYQGEILSDSVAKLRANKKQDQYFINLVDGRIMDSIKSNCFAKYANDAKGYINLLFSNNAKIGLDENLNICLIALRKIKAEEEIFCSYGKNYWKKHRVD